MVDLVNPRLEPETPYSQIPVPTTRSRYIVLTLTTTETHTLVDDARCLHVYSVDVYLHKNVGSCLHRSVRYIRWRKTL